MLAYLVIREGTKWTDVYRLLPGQTATIGRAPTNQIVLKDERCSRHHAEVFLSEGRWTLRDLDSRNGTAIGELAVRGDHPLSPGEVIRIGKSQLAFVHDLSKAFADSSTVLDSPLKASHVLPAAKATTPLRRTVDDASVLSPHEPTTITHRRGETRFLAAEAPSSDDSGISRAGQAAARLCRLGFELAKSPDVASIANLALDGLFEATQVDTGALLLFPRSDVEGPTGESLEVISARTTTNEPYYRVSNFLADTVLREGEAVLARNVMGDSTLTRRDSKGEIHATSVICAPVRRGEKLFGLLHLYSSDAARVLDPEDLEFTLAVAESVAVALHNLGRRQELAENLSVVRDENAQLRERLGVESEIVGHSEAIMRVNEEIARAAPSRATVLIRGESGCGKELVARAMHYASPRRKGVFVCLNCAALTESLLESELFGHERGAFTGATERKIGKFEAAHRGTLMLDEIGEMSPTIQAKFLRVLEGHPFERVGGSEQVKVDVRVIAATNRDLEKDVARGTFRRDLYFRLAVLEIIVPALRKRPDDIPDLAHHFLHKYTSETGRRIRGFTQAAMDLLIRYRWPGNVRELKNVIERAVVLARSDVIDQEDLLLSKLPTAGDTVDNPPQVESTAYVPLSLEEVERRHILATLRSTGWNKSQTATILGIERSTLDRKIRRYELARSGSMPGGRLRADEWSQPSTDTI
ncbi:MAG: sigma 54-interacting transcriptional regulator [Pirellulales bacterium]|nr:sigma 54-interacting transcriptional regulator [Pirellulales bacterium]